MYIKIDPPHRPVSYFDLTPGDVFQLASCTGLKLKTDEGYTQLHSPFCYNEDVDVNSYLDVVYFGRVLGPTANEEEINDD